MGLAAHKIEPDSREQFRYMIHDEVDKWVDQIIDEVFEDDKQPTIMEFSELFAKTKQKFLGACFQALIEQKYAGLLEQEYVSCPKCGKMYKKRRDNKKEMVTMQGQSELKRPWFYCGDCSYGFSPLDKVLEISRKKYQFDVQKKSTKTTAEVPFCCSSELFEDLTGHRISDHFMHDTFEQVGAQTCLADVIPGKEEIEKRCREAAGDAWRP
jgi:hypothetical protein